MNIDVGDYYKELYENHGAFCFWNDHFCSNWWTTDNQLYLEHTFWDNVEQYMMWKKAQHFGDQEIATKLRTEPMHPAEAKKLGRQVKGFNDTEWAKVRYDVVFKANLEKFKRNSKLAVSLIATGNKLIVEASPYDRIWGTGFDERETLKHSYDEWGQNLLGKVLVDVRDYLIRRIDDEYKYVVRRDDTGEMLRSYYTNGRRTIRG